MVYFLRAVGTLLLLYFCSTVYRLTRNIVKARAVEVPTVLVPVDQGNLLWLILAGTNRNRLRRLLPAQLWSRIALTIFGWEFDEKLQPFEKFAARDGNIKCKSYLLVGFGPLDFWTADPIAAREICLRVRDFEVPHAIEHALGPYGPNVMTTNGDRWARHRRIVTSVFDDRISKLAFEESMRQTHGLLEEIFSSAGGKQNGSAETPLIFDMIKKITIHVLFGAGLGTRVPWKYEEDKGLQPGNRMFQVESLTAVVSNLVGATLVPTGILLRWPQWLPGYRKMTTVGRAKVEVHKHSKSMLDQERNRIAKNDTGGLKANNIMNKLLQASEFSSTPGQSLSEDEMISNLFVLTAAGFETTATTLAYSVVLLARHAQWQDWLLEEVDSLAPPENTRPIEYATVFPQANRIMAFMLETVRLYSPAPHVHREVISPQTLQTSTGTIGLPAGTRVYVNSLAIHLLPSWRDVNRQSDPGFLEPDPEVPDEYTFRPSRWINPQGSVHAVYHPPKGTFLPWAMGPRICPGQKMAQVEFTAVLLALLQRHRIEAAPLKGEGQREIEERLDARLRDSRWVTVLQMNGVFDAKENGGLCIRISSRK